MAIKVSTGSPTSLWPPAALTSPARQISWGIHLGLGLVCFSAIYTLQPGDFTPLRWAGLAIVGLVLIVSAAATRGLIALRRAGRLLLALGAGLVLSLAFEPLLEDLPGLRDKLGESWTQLYPGLAAVGVGVALFSWLLFYLAAGERGLHPVPFRRSVLLTAALLLGLTAVMYIGLRPLYGMDGGQNTRFIIFTVLQYAALLVVVLGSCGGPGVRGWPFLYLGGTLLAIPVRNFIAGGGPLP